MSKTMEASAILAPIQPIMDAIASENFPPDGTTFIELAEQLRPLLALDVCKLNACKGSAKETRTVLSMRDEALYHLCALARHEAAYAA
ncbi:hypothetical protein [Ciceribacter sp. L1K22]|uniref:hypothetical protein n=1 Tax=Ciceribacter sp. L1K22 TaxID=2820275 RepID=UPI001ABE974D|nr:hypothetical protein [Ciceribacter sp. L1K22]MBO3760036.1 hypothetical protein [Ciceribacter sp. L1K22]